MIRPVVLVGPALSPVRSSTARLALTFPVPFHRRLVAAFLFLFAWSLSGQTFGGGVSSELIRFLQLTPEQGTAINRLAASWRSELQSLEQRAAGKPSEPVCRDAAAAREALIQKTRALLTKDQLSRLQLLEDALNLFPRVLEAQKAGLLPDALATSPIGLPAGQITTELAFTAGPPKPLPGCPPARTEVRPGIVPGR